MSFFFLCVRCSFDESLFCLQVWSERVLEVLGCGSALQGRWADVVGGPHSQRPGRDDAPGDEAQRQETRRPAHLTRGHRCALSSKFTSITSQTPADFWKKCPKEIKKKMIQLKAGTTYLKCGAEKKVKPIVRLFRIVQMIPENVWPHHRPMVWPMGRF